MKIMVSAGHYPTRPGACYKGFCEHDEAVLWADRVTMLLGNIGQRVPEGILKNKIDFIKHRNPSLAIEIHFNAAKDEHGVNVGHGCEVLYCPGSSSGKFIATHVQERLVSVMGNRDRGVKEGWYRMRKELGPDFFLVKTPCPAIVIEPEFIHFQERIQTKRNEACGAIATAIIEVLRGDV